MITRYTPERVTHLPPNHIFVYGSNLAGRHGKGAAADALMFGARYGVGKGLVGNTYAIPTRDERIRTLPLPSIFGSVIEFNNFAYKHSDLIFLVTRIGCGLAGLEDRQIAPMFTKSPNVLFPREWIEPECLVRDRRHGLIVRDDEVYIRFNIGANPLK